MEPRSTLSLLSYLPDVIIFMHLCLSSPTLLHSFPRRGLSVCHVPSTLPGPGETAGMHRRESIAGYMGLLPVGDGKRHVLNPQILQCVRRSCGKNREQGEKGWGAQGQEDVVISLKK